MDLRGLGKVRIRPAEPLGQESEEEVRRRGGGSGEAAEKAPAPAGAPAAGANSFTEGQARSRLESNGFTNVSGLQKDNSGVWRGKASKGGRTLDVAVDYQGNIVER